MICGIDFGARRSGTTALCYDRDGTLHIERVAKGRDADAHVEAFVRAHRPTALYIDAPLSLPAAYRGAGDDFFFRACDRALHAMSPMFLGGLVARAMRLCRCLAPVPVYEVYPRAAAQLLRQQYGVTGYRETRPQAYAAKLAGTRNLAVATTPTTWHEVDAWLAWWVGYRHMQGQARAYGDPTEGLVWV